VASLDPLPEADVYLLAVPDGAIQEVTEQILPQLSRTVVLIHFAGSLGTSPLAEAIEDGHGGCALHPVQAFVTVDEVLPRLPGTWWGMTCSAGWEPWAERLVRHDLAGHPASVAEADRPLWHAASVMTSNGLGALVSIGAELLRSIGVQDPASVLEPLAQGTLRNVLDRGAHPQGITGPVVRGEAATVDLHLRRLAERAPELLESYRAVARTILVAAAGAGLIEAPQRATFEDLLGDDRADG
jgi:predicted short-subunit dehydrogenase-like oxidoreductase (DUF2520 family)